MEEFKKNVTVRCNHAYSYAKAHLDEEDVTYPRHCSKTMLQAGQALGATLAYIAHALLPFILPQAGDDIISKLAESNQVTDDKDN